MLGVAEESVDFDDVGVAEVHLDLELSGYLVHHVLPYHFFLSQDLHREDHAALLLHSKVDAAEPTLAQLSEEEEVLYLGEGFGGFLLEEGGAVEEGRDVAGRRDEDVL